MLNIDQLPTVAQRHGISPAESLVLVFATVLAMTTDEAASLCSKELAAENCQQAVQSCIKKQLVRLSAGKLVLTSEGTTLAHAVTAELSRQRSKSKKPRNGKSGIFKAT